MQPSQNNPNKALIKICGAYFLSVMFTVSLFFYWFLGSHQNGSLWIILALLVTLFISLPFILGTGVEMLLKKPKVTILVAAGTASGILLSMLAISSADVSEGLTGLAGIMVILLTIAYAFSAFWFYRMWWRKRS